MGIGNVVYSGVDAFTVTSSITGDNRTRARMAVSELADYLQTEYFYTDKVVRITAGKGKGWRRGSLAYMSYWDKGKALYNQVSVTGRLANVAADLILTYEEEVKPTRIDFAVDVELSRPTPGLASGVYTKLSSYDKSARLIKSATGDTLYKNSRQSGRFGRLYDKSADYGLEAGSGKIWRYEVELKKVNAPRAMKTLREAEYIPSVIEEVSRAIWTGWNVPFLSDGEFQKLRRVTVDVTTLDKRFEWLCTISGAIRELVYAGKEAEIRELLDLPLFTLRDSEGIERLPTDSQLPLICEG